MERFEDPSDPLNGQQHHTGKTCIEHGCENPAGTHWSPYWCQPCNMKRMRRIDNGLKSALAELDGQRHNAKLCGGTSATNA